MKNLLLKLLDILIPPVCALCNERVSESATLCPKCFAELNFITKPYCKVCGRPFGCEVFGDMLCGHCLEKLPRFKKARSVLVYDGAAKKLILAFKHGDRLDLGPLLVKVMLRGAEELMPEVDIVMPVPLHRLRLLKRKYNQSAILAKHLAKHFHKSYNLDILKRVRSSRNQGHLTASERRKNVMNAFCVKPSNILQDKTILLVDDVLTTGATANECAKVLLKAGAKQVFLLTFASTSPHFSK